MMTGDRCAQQEKRKRARSRDRGIKCDRERQRVIVAEINRDPGDERDPKEQIDVCSRNDRIVFARVLADVRKFARRETFDDDVCVVEMQVQHLE
jgi:hypothetical protein